MPVTRVIIALALAALAGCASVPSSISTPVPGPDVRAVLNDPGRYTGAKVRWGGTIAGVTNLADRTVVTVVARPLTGDGEPLGDRPALGRFFAEVDRFLEPEEYRSGRRVTVVGRYVGIRQSKIDQYVYDYPVVQAQNLHMWREYAERRPYRAWPSYRSYPYWYDPYWSRYHGFMHYPWYY